MKKYLLLSALCASTLLPALGQKKGTSPLPKTPNDAAIATLGGVPVSSADFEYYYKKNNANEEDTEDALRSYLQLYLDFRLKVMDAEALKLDTAIGFQRELETYVKQLAQPYLTDKEANEALVKEAYERMKEEVKAAHILVNCPPDAAPVDSLAAYKKALSYRERILKGEDFANLAQQVSDDPSAKQNGGLLGYFSSMQMVYPFESAAFGQKVGSISMPVRTRFGYHIIQVLGRRPNQGKVKTAHIMVRLSPEMSKVDSTAAKDKIDEIYAKLLKGEEFKTLAGQFSDDAGTKDNGGELPEFGAGQMIPEFEEPVFKLKASDEITKPFLTPYGWHIAKLIERKPLESYEELKPTLAQKVQKDSRSALNRDVLVEKLKKENGFKENTKILKAAFAKADTSLLNANWRYNIGDKLNDKLLFSIGSEQYNVRDFFVYVQTSQVPHPKSDATFLMQEAYAEFVKKTNIDYEQAHLAEKYLDYRMLVREYRDGMLLFQRMEDRVWNKAMEDTAGLKAFFEKNRDNYRWGTRARATVYSTANADVMKQVRSLVAAGYFPVDEPKVNEITFEKNSTTLSDAATTSIIQLANALRFDRNLRVQLNAYAQKGEKKNIAASRLALLRDSLLKRGAEASQVLLSDQSKAKDRKESVVSPQLQGTGHKHIEKKLNASNPLAVQVADGTFSKGENKHVDKVKWAQGDYTLSDEDRSVLIYIHAVEEPRQKRLDETRGPVINDYQNHLDREWVQSLRAKHPVVVNEAELKRIAQAK